MSQVRSFQALAVLVIATAALASPVDLAGQQEAEVLAVVQELFDAMATGDAARAAAVLLPDGQWVAVGDGDGVGVPGVTPLRDFLERMDAAGERWLERMWDPEVLIHDPIAVVWTPYDFYRNGVFSHCGVDAITMVRTADGWRIAGGTYTVETTGCPSSPLGPPQHP
jgi:hypothetical protein